MVKRPYSKFGEDPFGENFEEFIRSVDKEMDRERPGWDEFRGVVDNDELEDMEKKTKRREAQMPESRNQEIALLGEWVVLEGIRNGWFGNAMVEVQPAHRYDDYFQKIDIICEFQSGDRIVPLAVDVTTADTVNGSDPLKASKVVFDKINGTQDRSKQGKHAGVAELFKSGFESKRPVGHQEMLKAVVVVDPQDVLQLAELSRRAGDGDEDALEELKESAFKYDFLGQIWASVEHAQRMARYVVRDQSKGPSEVTLASQIVAETERLENIIAEAGEGGEIKIGNELVDMIWNGTVPSKLLQAIKATELDEYYMYV